MHGWSNKGDTTRKTTKFEGKKTRHSNCGSILIYKKNLTMGFTGGLA